MKIFLIINGHLLVVPIVFISFRLLFLTGRKGYGKKIMSASGPALYYCFRTCIIASGPALMTTNRRMAFWREVISLDLTKCMPIFYLS